MKDLKDFLNESLLNESFVDKAVKELYSILTNDAKVKDLTKEFGKNAKEKKVFKAFIEFLSDKLDEWKDSIDEWKDYLNDEAFDDFLNCYKVYGLKDGADEDFDDMDFEGLCNKVAELV